MTTVECKFTDRQQVPRLVSKQNGDFETFEVVEGMLY